MTQKLCKCFSHEGVEIYVVNGKLYFGEMTFTTAEGMCRISPEYLDYIFGSLWPFDNNLRNTLKSEKDFS